MRCKHNLFNLFWTVLISVLVTGARCQAIPLTGVVNSNLLTSSPVASDLASDFGHLPLSFIPNAGQTDPAVHYQAHSLGGTVFFTPNEVVLSLPASTSAAISKVSEYAKAEISSSSNVLRLRFEGANPAPTIISADPLPGRINYFIGNDPDQWRTNLPTYEGVDYQNLYPGIDLRYDGTRSTLKGTYIITPGADPNLIRWHYEGVESVHIDEVNGDLRIALPTVSDSEAAAEIVERAPTAWQSIDGQHIPVSVHYFLLNEGGEPIQNLAIGRQAKSKVQNPAIGLALGTYDPTHPLILDPTLEYSTFLGGLGYDEGLSIAVDEAGNVYITGTTDGSGFPTTEGAFDTSYYGSGDTFVAKLNPSGTLLYSTFLGGFFPDAGFGIAVDETGNAYVTGRTNSGDFPITEGAFDTSYGYSNNDVGDAFVAKLNSDGSALLYSTVLGGDGREYGYDIAVDGDGNAYVTGRTDSSGFPTTAGAFDTLYNGDRDAFVTKLNPEGSALLYSTFLGGYQIDEGLGIAVDKTGHAYVTGRTDSSGFPTTGDAFDTDYNGNTEVFVIKLDSDGSTLLYSTFLGGASLDEGWDIAVGGGGNAYVIGRTDSGGFPTTGGAFDTNHNGGPDVFVAKFTTNEAGGVQPPAGLVSWWPGDGNANDIVGNNDGTLMNGATFAPGFAGQAFSFDGRDDFVELPEIEYGPEITIAAWVKTDGIGTAGQAIFGVCDDPNSPLACTGADYKTIGLSIGSEAGISAGFSPSVWGERRLHAVTADGLIDADTCYHIATAINSNTNTVKIYLDGAEQMNILTSAQSIAGSGGGAFTGEAFIGQLMIHTLETLLPFSTVSLTKSNSSTVSFPLRKSRPSSPLAVQACAKIRLSGWASPPPPPCLTAQWQNSTRPLSKRSVACLPTPGPSPQAYCHLA